jgi:hypothetical protein
VAWDHHRFVSTLRDHHWALPPKPAGAGGPRFAEVLEPWTRLDGVDSGLLLSLRRTVAAYVMKHPGAPEAAVAATVFCIAPQEVADILAGLVFDGFLTQRTVAVKAPRTSLFGEPRPASEPVACFWATAAVGQGRL